jgi:hypothetical protein
VKSYETKRTSAFVRKDWILTSAFNNVEKVESADYAVQANEQAADYQLQAEDVNKTISRDSIVISASAYSFLERLKESGGDVDFQRFPDGDGKSQAIKELLQTKQVIEKQGDRKNALYRICVDFDRVELSKEEPPKRKPRKQTLPMFKTMPNVPVLLDFMVEVKAVSKELGGSKTAELREQIVAKKLALTNCDDESEEARLIVELGELNSARRNLETDALAEAIRTTSDKDQYRDYGFAEWMIGWLQENTPTK